jgi:hypothetical protein
VCARRKKQRENIGDFPEDLRNKTVGWVGESSPVTRHPLRDRSPTRKLSLLPIPSLRIQKRRCANGANLRRSTFDNRRSASCNELPDGKLDAGPYLLGVAAKWSLTANPRGHHKVLELCRSDRLTHFLAMRQALQHCTRFSARGGVGGATAYSSSFGRGQP